MRSEIISGTDADERPRVNVFLLYCGLIGLALFAVVNFTFGAINPYYIVVHQSFGDLQMLHHGWIQSLNTVIYGVVVWAFAIGLRRELGNSGFGHKWLPLMHEFMAVGLIMAGLFVYDPAHSIAGAVVFVSMVMCHILFAIRFAGDTRWKGWTVYTMVTAIVMCAMMIAYISLKYTPGSYAGLFERMAMLVRGIWFFFFTTKIAAGVRLN